MARNPFASKGPTGAVLVVGLGRFGTSVALSLATQGVEVLAIDGDIDLVQKYADDLTHVVQADSTDPEALQQLGVEHFQKAVIGTASDVEASVLTAIALVEAGVPDIWAKASSKAHGHILERIGVHHIVYPETQAGEQVAHLIVGGMSQYIEFDDEFAIARTMAPVEQWDRTFEETGLRKRYGVTVVGVKRPGADFVYAKPETFVHPNDELVVSGPTRAVEAFCALSTVTTRD